MGKAKKIKVSKNGMAKVALADQIEDCSVIKSKSRQKTRVRKDSDDEYHPADLTEKIFKLAGKQRIEEEEESTNEDEDVSNRAIKKTVTKLGGSAMSEDEDDDDDDMPIEDDNDMPTSSDRHCYEYIELDPEEEHALQIFQAPNIKPTLTLGDHIKKAQEYANNSLSINNKISEKASDIGALQSEAGDFNIIKLDPRVQAMYEGVGDVLTKYRSGKLPKAFKLIPSLRNWEQILYLTKPENWSAAAMYQATRIFSSSLSKKMAQRFHNLVLLPRIRDDLAEYKRLNFHLYQALKKSLFKPGAFMKGILLPLLESGNCTLREAVIIGSVVSKHSIPMLHSSAAMLKIAEMEYTGANSIFLRIFFDKKYTLPYRVVDGVVHHFLKFERETRILPVLWHQAFLTFIQRYKTDISTEQKEALLELLKRQAHPTITPEIRRELVNSKCRDEEYMEPMNN